MDARADKWTCFNADCMVSIMSLSDPKQCPRCGTFAMQKVEEGVTDVPSALYEKLRREEMERQAEPEIDWDYFELWRGDADAE